MTSHNSLRPGEDWDPTRAYEVTVPYLQETNAIDYTCISYDIYIYIYIHIYIYIYITVTYSNA